MSVTLALDVAHASDTSKRNTTSLALSSKMAKNVEYKSAHKTIVAATSHSVHKLIYECLNELSNVYSGRKYQSKITDGNDMNRIM